MSATSQMESGASKRLAVVTGEASGDWIAALAIESLNGSTSEKSPEWRVEGVAGPKLRQHGVKALHQSEELSVRGYVEVIRHLPRLLKMRKGLIEYWSQSNRPSVFMGVDAPDFNLAIELALKEKGIPTIHLVCPSIWAWRMERIHTLKKACDHVLCLFPFEPAILSKENIPATYIGHPMAHLVPESINIAQFRSELGLEQGAPLLAVLPGSRMAEVKHLGPVFVETCRRLRKTRPDLRFITPLPSGPIYQYFAGLIPDEMREFWTLQEGKSHETMGAANAVLLASGTATLEAMMFKKPMVIAYKMPWLSYQMMKGKGYLPYVGLPNILLNEFAVPELIQNEATADKLHDAVLFQLDDEANRTRLEALFSEQHALLTQPSGQICAQTIEALAR